MSDEFGEHIEPVSGGSRIDRLEGERSRGAASRRRSTVAGHVVSVRRARKHRDGHHVLDVSVGGEEYTEIVLRVPHGSYEHLEGKQATLFVEE